jgi:dGTP triphosphohydrolase
MEWADDLAYAIHDFEDAVQAGFITRGAIKRVRDPLLEAVKGDLRGVVDDTKLLEEDFGFWERQIDAELDSIQTAANVEAALRPTTRKWFGQLVDATSIRAPQGTDTTTTGYWVDVDPQKRVLVSVLKNLGFELLIRDERIVRYLRKGTVMLERSFTELMDDPKVVDDRVGQLMPRHLSDRLQTADEPTRARAVCDFLASMSEPGLTHFYGTLFETSEGSPLF